ncbi:hypothetical protein CEJ42_04090 [Herbaspirillum robiniae]|uniref:Uncharacterized protein n=1 Tax=Herbaspirillum robiniae TaxID=2014887 RepID=A0A246WW15_9BURK|nr:hypothetical protein CEJ42_04090 [Herbaspirillum robiniae]
MGHDIDSRQGRPARVKPVMAYHAVGLSIGAALAFLSAKQRVKSPICSHFPASHPLAPDHGFPFIFATWFEF